MADRFSPDVRSKIMSKIKGKDTKPEMLIRKELFGKGYRYSLRRRFKELNFRPDLVMVSRRTCIFVDGCFWHGCPQCYKRPKTNRRFWKNKIKRNVERDKEQNEFLLEHGWKVIRVWEHDVMKDFNDTIEKIIDKIESDV